MADGINLKKQLEKDTDVIFLKIHVTRLSLGSEKINYGIMC